MNSFIKQYLVLSLAILFSISFEIENSIAQVPSTNGLQEFITAFQRRDTIKIASYFSYPINLSYPIPKIDDENECISRFSEIFDDSIINQIAESDINYDWNYSGWRGFSFQNGLLWIDERFLIYKVNYLTKVADSLKREFLLNDKLALHESLRDFSKPKYLFGFNNYFGRIDELNDQTLRLVLWQKGTETQLTKPDIIAFTDEFIVEGTIRNESTIFKLTDFTYEFSFDSNYPEVTISKDGEVILNATLTIYSW